MFRSDVWSFGILMFEVLSIGEMPYRSVKMADYKKRLKTEWEWFLVKILNRQKKFYFPRYPRAKILLSYSQPQPVLTWLF